MAVWKTIYSDLQPQQDFGALSVALSSAQQKGLCHKKQSPFELSISGLLNQAAD
jgi:hypothetical protein